MEGSNCREESAYEDAQLLTDTETSEIYVTAVWDPNCWSSNNVPEAAGVASTSNSCQQSSNLEYDAEIESSKGNWSELSSDGIKLDDEQKKKKIEENRRVFESLLEEWPDGLFKNKKFVLGKKIAEGAQAEIFECVSPDQPNPDGPVVLKVFKLEGASLSDLRKQWPLGLLHNCKMVNVFSSWAASATLLEDGRFAFEMWRYGADLRTLIDSRMKGNHNQGPPFTNAQAYHIMWAIAKGMEELHSINILHRDLKAANVLVRSSLDDLNVQSRIFNIHSKCWAMPLAQEISDGVLKLLLPPQFDHLEAQVIRCSESYEVHETSVGVFQVLIPPCYDDLEVQLIRGGPLRHPFERFTCYVADYECSGGVIGTAFWRAPEILCALQNKDYSIHDKPELFSQAADVYSYATTCYEVLTGNIPFDDVVRNDYEAIFSGQRRLEWPHDVEPQFKAMLERCSHLQPSERPTFQEILGVLEVKEEENEDEEEKEKQEPA